MMLRTVAWQSWIAGIFLAAVYIALGFWLRGNGHVEYELFKWGLTALTFAPLVMMGIYTATGNKWWKNDLGSALGWLAGGITWMAWPLAYTFWFLHGSLPPSWVGWSEVSGPALIAAAILRLCYVFLRYHRDKGSLCFISLRSCCSFSQLSSTLSLLPTGSGRRSSSRSSD